MLPLLFQCMLLHGVVRVAVPDLVLQLECCCSVCVGVGDCGGDGVVMVLLVEIVSYHMLVMEV